jgi:hypothetical protein
MLRPSEIKGVIPFARTVKQVEERQAAIGENLRGLVFAEFKLNITSMF